MAFGGLYAVHMVYDMARLYDRIELRQYWCRYRMVLHRTGMGTHGSWFGRDDCRILARQWFVELVGWPVLSDALPDIIR